MKYRAATTTAPTKTFETARPAGTITSAYPCASDHSLRSPLYRLNRSAKEKFPSGSGWEAIPSQAGAVRYFREEPANALSTLFSHSSINGGRNQSGSVQFHRRIMKLEEPTMISKYLASALVITALGVTVAAAQTATSRAEAPVASAAHRDGEWRASNSSASTSITSQRKNRRHQRDHPR